MKRKILIGGALILAIAGTFAEKPAKPMFAADLFLQVAGCPAECSTSGTITCTNVPAGTSLFKKNITGNCTVVYSGNRFQP
jgi:hypothetical protein